MGELRGELAERYNQLVKDKKKLVKQNDDGDTIPSNNNDKPGNVTKQMESEARNFTSRNDEKSEKESKFPETDVSNVASETAVPRRRSYNRAVYKRAMEERAAKYQQRVAQRQQKDCVSDDIVETNDDKGIPVEQTSDVSSNYVGSQNEETEGGKSSETRRVTNTAAHQAAITATPVVIKEHKSDDNDSNDSFPPLDWKEIEREAKNCAKNVSMDSDPSFVKRVQSDLSNPKNVALQLETCSDTPTDSLDIHKGANANVSRGLGKDNSTLKAAESNKEKGVITVGDEHKGLEMSLRGEEADYKKQEDRNADDFKSELQTEDGQKGPQETTNDMTFEDNYGNHISVPVKQSRLEAKLSASTGGPSNALEEASGRSTRAYHRPHTGEKVIIGQSGEIGNNGQFGMAENKTHAVVKDGRPPVYPDKDSLRKDDEKEDISQSSHKKKKKTGLPKPKRRSRKHSRKAGKDADPLGRAVSLAFDKFAGYSGLQEDWHSVAASDGNTFDDDYSTDESESIVSDLHDVFLSTFGCSIPQATTRQIHDDDTLDTDNGSKLSTKSGSKFIRHSRSASDSVNSDPSCTIPYASSYDKTEGTNEDVANDDLTDFRKETMQNKAPVPSNIRDDAPKFKIPDSFDGKPPDLPSTKRASLPKDTSMKDKSSIYSDHTGTYMDFVEKDHQPVNLLEDADNFLFEDISTDFLKAANTNVDKFVASIQGLLGSNFDVMKEKKQREVDKDFEAKAVNYGIPLNTTSGPTTSDSSTPTDEKIDSQDDDNETKDSLFAMSPQSGRSSDDGSENTLNALRTQLVAEARTMTASSPFDKVVEEEKKEAECDEHEEASKGKEISFLEEEKANNLGLEANGIIMDPKVGTKIISLQPGDDDLGETSARSDCHVALSGDGIKAVGHLGTNVTSSHEVEIYATDENLSTDNPDISVEGERSNILEVEAATEILLVEKEDSPSSTTSQNARHNEISAAEPTEKPSLPLLKSEEGLKSVPADTWKNELTSIDNTSIEFSSIHNNASLPQRALPLEVASAESNLSMSSSTDATKVSAKPAKRFGQAPRSKDTSELQISKGSLTQSPMTTKLDQKKKKKPGIMKGLLNPFKRKKDERATKGKVSDERVKGRFEKSHETNSRTRGRSNFGHETKECSGTDVNKLMASHLSEKYENNTSAFDSILSPHAIFDDWDKIVAQAPSQTTGQRTETLTESTIKCSFQKGIESEKPSSSTLMNAYKHESEEVQWSELNFTLEHMQGKKAFRCLPPPKADSAHKTASTRQRPPSNRTPSPSDLNFETIVDQTNKEIIVNQVKEEIGSILDASNNNSQSLGILDDVFNGSQQDFHIASVFQTEPYKNVLDQKEDKGNKGADNYIGHKSEKWESVFDSSNEGIDVREASQEISFSSDNFVLDLAKEASIDTSRGPQSSPQKVSDFPFKAIQTQASF